MRFLFVVAVVMSVLISPAAADAAPCFGTTVIAPQTTYWRAWDHGKGEITGKFYMELHRQADGSLQGTFLDATTNRDISGSLNSSGYYELTATGVGAPGRILYLKLSDDGNFLNGIMRYMPNPEAHEQVSFVVSLAAVASSEPLVRCV